MYKVFMVYNSKHMCSYQYYDPKFMDFIPKNLIVTEEVEQCEDSADLIYKSDILQVFDLIDYDDAKIQEEMKILFEKTKHNKNMVECMKILASRFLTEELEFGFVLLFSYDTFFATHLCICDVIEKGDISQDNMNRLSKLIN
jgi:hypothetical protein